MKEENLTSAVNGKLVLFPVWCYGRHLSLALQLQVPPQVRSFAIFKTPCVSSPSYGLQGLCWVLPPDMHWHSMLGGSKLNAFLQHC